MAKAQARSTAAPTKTAAANKPADDAETTETVADGPVLDLSNAAVKRMIKLAKQARVRDL